MNDSERFEDTPIARRVAGLWLPDLPAGTNIYTATAAERRDAWDRLRKGLPRTAADARAFCRARNAEARREPTIRVTAASPLPERTAEETAELVKRQNAAQRKQASDAEKAHEDLLSQAREWTRKASARVRLSIAAIYASRRATPSTTASTPAPTNAKTPARTFADLAAQQYEPSPGTALIGASQRGGVR